MPSRIRGLVKWYKEDKGFGFISPLDGGKDISVNVSNLQGDNCQTLFEGQKVEYTIYKSNKGPAASNVILCEK
ncbi:cold-shock protein [Lelliottia amnigena]